MAHVETITTKSGFPISIESTVLADGGQIILRIDKEEPCLLHWGMRRDRYSPWRIPPASIWPEGSKPFNQTAVQTPFLRKNGYSEITVKVDSSQGLRLLDFVLFFPKEGRWDNNDGRNYSMEVPAGTRSAPSGPSLNDPDLDRLAGEIIEKEMGRNSWTLMHRFNLCYDLLDKVKSNSLEGMALIFVWLRFSALRQLEWQRNYNTKPRELGHAMDRLTLKLGDRFTKWHYEREIIRLIMTTLGRGSNAQRVRDEVLNIMHRHNIKEVSGHFMEEWHQKLHNNTTPDDVVICEAYLEFLKSNGNLGRFYQRLQEGGVTKARLEGYERPIKSDPDFIPHLKDALVRDFENFLGILKEVHAGTDLGVAIKASRYLFDAEMHAVMDFIWFHQNDRNVVLLARKIAESRRRLEAQLDGPSYKVRDLLFLDIALEEFLRVVVERNLGPQLGPDQLVDLIAEILENIFLSNKDAEIHNCLNHWNRLKELPRFGREWSLQAESVLERIGRVIASFIDRLHQLLQPKAEFLGNAFHADSWAIRLFSEEVLRGSTAFILSAVVRYLAPLLRKDAGLGDWQIISPGHGIGEVKAAETLRSVQGKSFAEAVILITGGIVGDEEIPQGVAVIITPAVVDSLSHLAIRARNAGILFAVCYDPDTIEKLKSLSGHRLKVSVRSSGDVDFEESAEETSALMQRVVRFPSAPSGAAFTSYSVTIDDFSERNVGYKSYKLRSILGKLPDWIKLPASVALPFGVFEEVLSEERNKDVSKKYEELKNRIGEEPGEARGEVLPEMRETILRLEAPEELVSSLRNTMEKAGLARQSDWNEAWTCIKRVWASKWNERAYLSRRANGIHHDALRMSVLIQRVVESDYSFVIHTANPFTGARDELYAEVVTGLGETLAANYPGRAVAFTFRRGGTEPRLVSFPSKSIGLYGGGIIFRSDSNGEDLAGYAGAGLYDSFVLPAPRRISLDYTGNPLVWDEGFRKKILTGIANVGATVEDVMKYPQDIEGAWAKEQYFVVQTRPQVGIESG